MAIELFQHLEPAVVKWSALRTAPPSVATPYLTMRGLSAFVSAVGKDAIHGSRWLVSLTLGNAVSEVTEPQAVLKLLDFEAEVRSLDTLHAKLYLLPTEDTLILGSANLTTGGLRGNLEIVLWTDEAKIVTEAGELFELWWARSRCVTSEEARVLQREAEEVRVRETVLRQLTEMGAFVTINTSKPDVQQQHTIQWEDVGVPRPSTGDIRPAPPTLLLWPQEVREEVSRAQRTVKSWLDRHAIELQERLFLTFTLFGDLARTIGAANGTLRQSLGSIRGEAWTKHHESLEEQLRKWLEEVAEDQNREQYWVDQRVASVLRGVPPATELSEAIRISHRLEMPHPESAGFNDLVDDIQAAIAAHPALIQPRLTGL